ncbi:hypothetical protein ACIQU5_10640 [Streptomyces sp. NPDC090306]|uniref:hypothetical protein n=1 Tax=Streptomyces sp. NPDC090306 TaxID=3365961 RepID=UPI0037F51152
MSDTTHDDTDDTDNTAAAATGSGTGDTGSDPGTDAGSGPDATVTLDDAQLARLADAVASGLAELLTAGTYLAEPVKVDVEVPDPATTEPEPEPGEPEVGTAPSGVGTSEPADDTPAGPTGPVVE